MRIRRVRRADVFAIDRAENEDVRTAYPTGIGSTATTVGTGGFSVGRGGGGGTLASETRGSHPSLVGPVPQINSAIGRP